ncbi:MULTISPECIES: ATPase domain-containing protein [Thermococcus]|uniref:RecA-superfamily ATPases implicated in signal transduction n=1 Tax=Thermococcus nautili TaxID=195522 RepID=W8NSN2_9EURY|nr:MULTISPECIES: ATPase domain-containing protein [Thermococcus]AHL22127.1 RecA-superfamily ATPases implicated in signal transduction [Thermococcus nautili]NJE48639.1 ATPase [Thermococcus sp. 9N3]CAI1493825.1 RecA-superfamily ATPases implicated in signal transduction [Thermococcus nautili]
MVAGRISTGVPGLDVMLHGGLIPGRVYLVKGSPGTGKTTLAMHFAMAGVANGESVLYITLEEPAENIREDFGRMGFDVYHEDFTLIDATPTTEHYVLVEDFFETFAKNLNKLTESIKEQFRVRRYSRVVVDPITMLKLATKDEIDYRRAFLTFVKSMMRLKVTVLITSELERTDIEEYLVSGVIEMKLLERDGKLMRAIKVTKFRGSGFDNVIRPYEITETGMVVHPDRTVP